MNYVVWHYWKFLHKDYHGTMALQISFQLLAIQLNLDAKKWTSWNTTKKYKTQKSLSLLLCFSWLMQIVPCQLQHTYEKYKMEKKSWMNENMVRDIVWKYNLILIANLFHPPEFVDCRNFLKKRLFILFINIYIFLLLNSSCFVFTIVFFYFIYRSIHSMIQHIIWNVIYIISENLSPIIVLNF